MEIAEMSPVHHHIRLSIFPIAIKILFLLVADAVLVSLLLILFVGTTVEPASIAFLLPVFIGLYCAKSAFLVYFMWLTVLNWLNTYYYLSNHHLIRYTGIMREDEEIYELQNIRAVTVRCSWLGNILGYGDITLAIGASGYNKNLRIHGIATPKKYELLLRSYLGVETRQFVGKETDASLIPERSPERQPDQ